MVQQWILGVIKGRNVINIFTFIFSIIEAQRFEIPEINSFDQIVNHTISH